MINSIGSPSVCKRVFPALWTILELSFNTWVSLAWYYILLGYMWWYILYLSQLVLSITLLSRLHGDAVSWSFLTWKSHLLPYQMPHPHISSWPIAAKVASFLPLRLMPAYDESRTDPEPIQCPAFVTRLLGFRKRERKRATPSYSFISLTYEFLTHNPCLWVYQSYFRRQSHSGRDSMVRPKDRYTRWWTEINL